MSQIIANQKNYTGQHLENIFFRPLLAGPSAVDLGVKVMYNMPVPTTLSFWKRDPDVLKKYTKGWAGSTPSAKFQKTIELSKVKAEVGYAAADYFSMVYEQLIGVPEVNMADLSGTQLEAAETELFKRSLAESIRATMWLGDTSRADMFNTFNGFFKRIVADSGLGDNAVKALPMTSMVTAGNAEKLLKSLYDGASPELKSMRGDGQLVFLVTSDVYENYEDSLMVGSLDSVRSARINGIDQLSYRGIPVVDIQVGKYLVDLEDVSQSWAILTDRRNLAMAVNTADFPGSEIAMWYNPDELENRQRAIFMAGCDYLLPELMVVAYKM